MLRVRGKYGMARCSYRESISQRSEVKIRARRSIMDGKYAEYVHENQKGGLINFTSHGKCLLSCVYSCGQRL